MNILNLSDVFGLIVLHELGYLREFEGQLKRPRTGSKDQQSKDLAELGRERERLLDLLGSELMEAVLTKVMERVQAEVEREPETIKGVKKKGQIKVHRERQDVVSDVKSEIDTLMFDPKRQRELEAAVLAAYARLKESREGNR